VLAENLLEDVPLGALMGGDAFAHLAVQLAEVLFHLTEIGQQGTGGVGDLQEAFPDLRGVHQGLGAGAHLLDPSVDGGALSLQFGEARLRVALAAFGDLAQQVEDQLQTGLGADEVALLETGHPLHRLFGRGREVIVRLVGIERVVAPQPTAAVVGPVSEVVEGRARMGILLQVAAHMMEVVVEARGQLPLIQGPEIGRDEAVVQETENQGRRISRQKSPGGMVAAQAGQVVIVH